jgi:hypothetical protein
MTEKRNGSDEEIARLRQPYDAGQAATKALSLHNEAAIKAVLKQRTQQHVNS